MPDFRPIRPTAAKAAAKSSATARLIEGDARISIRVTADSLQALKLAAVTRRMTVKKLVLEALRADGVPIPHETDE